MADIRIKDLTTTASSTASDDFIAVDGATNGTRKLNAYSPTFGGNATVAGTLTVNGTGASSFAGRLAIGASALSDRMFYVSGNTGTTGASQFAAVVNPTIPNTVTTGAYGLYLGTNIAAGATVTNGYSLFIAAPDYTGSTVTNKYGLYSNDPNPSYFVGRVLIDNSTASTSTSTGALVVNGGVGVAGAAYVGGNATVFGTAGITINNINGLGNDSILTLTQSGVSNAFIKNTATTGDIAIGDGGGTYLRITKGVGVVSLLNTSASTSTSTGALVVSGGVGVAGTIYAGGEITSNSTNGFGFRHSAAAGLYRGVKISTSGSDRWLFAANDASEAGSNAGSDLVLFSYSDAGTFLREDLKLTRSTGAAKFGGSIQTSAPAGGTAAAWKLGTVASVSPTSPNRTIEVDIGGTIYYIHAKTTNN